MEESVHPTTLLSLSLSSEKTRSFFSLFLLPLFPFVPSIERSETIGFFPFLSFFFLSKHPRDRSSTTILFSFFSFSSSPFSFLFFSFFFFLHPRHARVVKDVQHGASCRYVSQCSSDDVIGVHERRLNERSFGAFADERNCSYVNALDCVNGHSTTRTYVRMYVRTWVGRRIGK